MSGWTLRDLLGLDAMVFNQHLAELLDARLVMDTSIGYVLAPGVVVSERGFVGRVIRPATMLGPGVPRGMWARLRKPLPSDVLVERELVAQESGRG